MIQIVALGDVEIHEKTTGYEIDISPVESSSGFTDFDGREIRPIMGHKTVISCTLKGVPHSIAEDIKRVIEAIADSGQRTF